MVERLRRIFADTFNIPVEMVTDDLSYNSIREWDSIAHMALIAALDREFEIMIDTEDVIDMSTFGKAREILAKYGINSQ